MKAVKHGGVDAFAADVGDERHRERIGEAIDIEHVAADGEMAARGEVRTADFAIRKRHVLAAKCALQNLGCRAFFLELAHQARSEPVEQDGEQTEEREPERTTPRIAIDLLLG